MLFPKPIAKAVVWIGLQIINCGGWVTAFGYNVPVSVSIHFHADDMPDDVSFVKVYGCND